KASMIAPTSGGPPPAPVRCARGRGAHVLRPANAPDDSSAVRRVAPNGRGGATGPVVALRADRPGFGGVIPPRRLVRQPPFEIMAGPVEPRTLVHSIGSGAAGVRRRGPCCGSIERPAAWPLGRCYRSCSP